MLFRSVLLVGKTDESGRAFVMEAGSRNVGVMPKRFIDSVAKDPLAYRDRSFTRLGHGGVAVDVKLGNVVYRLEQAGRTWDAEIGSERRPADGNAVARLLDRIR